MNLLLEKYNEYKTIVNYRVEYELDGQIVFDFRFKQSDFPHLIGLHKLVDIPVIGQFNDKNNKTVGTKYLISKIKQEKILTDSIICGSSYFKEIKDRYFGFNKNNLLSLSYTDVIINFNPLLINSTLNADYILFEKQSGQGYNHLCIAQDRNGARYAESFFYNPNDLYIRNQNIVKVKKVTIYDAKNNIYLSDSRF